MELVLAMDLRHNLVVHGTSGRRETYKPLDWGLSPTADPLGYLAAVAPKFLYIADLDRIEGTGSHDSLVQACAERVACCYVDRGCRSPDDMLSGSHIKNIVGTETAGMNRARYRNGYLSIDIRDGTVIPSGESPADLLRAARDWRFEGCIILNLGAVGTGTGVDEPALARLRDAYDKRLFYGGGVADPEDLLAISAAGFDGAIIATALHRGTIPLASIRRGTWS